MRIHFVLVAEGTSDNGLVPHLEQLCIYCGATEVTGVEVDFRRFESGKSVEEKLRRARELEPDANLFFIHRDADKRDASPRYQEISAAVTACDLTCNWVAVVPIQETEAWLLLSESAIRKVSSRPRGTQPLDLPLPRTIEDIASPKERLQEVLVQASETTGRRLHKFKNKFPMHRKLLLERLPIEGPLLDVPSWTRLRDDLCQALEDLQASSRQGNGQHA